MLPTVLDDLLRRRLGTLVQNDDRNDVLSPGPVGNSDHRCVGNSRVGFQAALHLGRVDVLSGRFDEPGLGPDEGERPVGLAPPEVVRVVPAPGATFFCDVGPVEVSVHHRRATDTDLAGLTLSDLVALGIEDPDPQERRRAAVASGAMARARRS